MSLNFSKQTFSLKQNKCKQKQKRCKEPGEKVKKYEKMAQPTIIMDSSGVVVGEETDTMIIRPLGAGQEVGRSCHYLEFKDKKILLDCGIHPGLSGMDALPFVDMIEADKIDLLLITHFHLDHAGALPWFLQKTTFKVLLQSIKKLQHL